MYGAYGEACMSFGFSLAFAAATERCASTRVRRISVFMANQMFVQVYCDSRCTSVSPVTVSALKNLSFALASPRRMFVIRSSRASLIPATLAYSFSIRCLKSLNRSSMVVVRAERVAGTSLITSMHDTS